MKPIPMDASRPQRDRLLARAAQIIVTSALITAFVLLSTSTTFGTRPYWIALPLLAAAEVCTVGLVTGLWRGALAGLALAAAATALEVGLLTPAGAYTGDYAVLVLLGVGMPAASILLLGRRLGTLWYWCSAAFALGVTIVALGSGSVWGLPLLFAALGWVVGYGGGLTLVRSIPDALRHVREIGLAHRAERQASEMEANRRQSARLLHDTVLATLTLLAHSGVGVSSEALRSQARNDAHLLRQLRLGEPLFTLPGAQYAPEPVEESTLGTTLESVRNRFDDLGLDVEWHGASRIALPQHVLDAFLFSISESLENVRRHAGVTTAHVTVTETESKVTAMITDAGKGFVPDEVSDQRLGIKESVMGRLAEIGGSAKVFSAPGAGTTVLLEVPR